MADEAATAEEEEGEIHEDQKLDPSLEGASVGLEAEDVEAAGCSVVFEAAAGLGASGGSAWVVDVVRLEPASL